MDHNRNIIVIDENWIVKKYFGRIEPPPKMERLQIIQKLNTKFRVSKFRMTNQTPRSFWTYPNFTWVNPGEKTRPGSPRWTISRSGVSGASKITHSSPGWSRMRKLVLVHQGEQFPGLECPEPPELLIVHPGEPGWGNSPWFTKVNSIQVWRVRSLPDYS